MCRSFMSDSALYLADSSVSSITFSCSRLFVDAIASIDFWSSVSRALAAILISSTRCESIDLYLSMCASVAADDGVLSVSQVDVIAAVA